MFIGLLVQFEFPFHHQPCSLPHQLPCFVVFYEPFDLIGQMGFVTEARQETGCTVANILRDTASFKGDHGSTAGHRFQADLGLVVFA